MRSALGTALVLANLLGAAPALPGEPGSLAAQLDTAAVTYHTDPEQLDRLRAALETAVATDPTAENWAALARVSFLWGDVRATAREAKLAAYDRGRQAGRRATELAPRDAAAHLWYAINTGRWGQTNGVARSLFLLSTVRQQLALALSLDPSLAAAHVVAGYVDYEVPALLGGDLRRAEASFRAALAQMPDFTAARVGLARTLAKQGKVGEARREAQRVLEERAPANAADWTVKDARDARELLAHLGGR